MNSSSSPPPFAAPLQTRHDVFISFRGEGTCDTFASHLHAALCGKNIETYIDTRPEKGDDIGPAHMEAIEKSKFSVVIFSKNYASSAWCLKELVHILGCKERYGQIVIPIFYGVDQSYVREKKGTYALKGRRLKKRFKGNMDEVPNWRDALEEAANMPEFHYSSKTGRTEADFVEKVVRDVLAKLNRELSSDLRVPFGIESKIEKIQAKYDVFLSFRGEDTRDTFTSYLLKALRGKKIVTYIDNMLERGEEIAPGLLRAIEESKIALVIFSEDYASSTWCLKELVHILGCKKSHGQIVIPIFYRINPRDVRKKQGTYALAIDELEKSCKGSTDEVVNWRKALKKASYISGFPYSSKKGKTEADFVEEVVQDVLTKLNRESSSDLKGLVGIQRKIEEIESLLCLDSPGVCCLGIWGMGGIGKTTLADAVFHRLSSKFEASCFLANVRENSENTSFHRLYALHQLRNKLVGEILKDKDVKIDTPSIPRHIQDRLRCTKALIVLDDVNARKQLEYLVGDDDRFGQGSRIIITARDKGLLEQRVDHEKIYNVEGLDSNDALRLFHSHAFGNKSPTTDHTKLSREVVDYVKGNPLALIVMGASFRHCKSKQEWKDQWKELKEYPDKEIDRVLRISYDGLGEREKEIFLDIVFFDKGYARKYVNPVLDWSALCGKKGINDLIDRSLISISRGRWIEMHDLVKEMGKAIAKKESSRLLEAKDVNQLLANNQIVGHVEAISIDWREMEYANFEKMHKLRWLRVDFYEHRATSLIRSLGLPNSLIYLSWEEYPLKSLPSKFSAQNLVVLEMPCSQVEGQLWNEDQSLANLKRIDLSECKHLTEVPNLSRIQKIEHINLWGCKCLVEIPSYFEHLGKLAYLNLSQCTNLKNLPKMPRNLEFLNLSETGIEELPSSIWSHKKISHLDITDCRHLKSLPSNTCNLKLSLSLKGCISLCEFWELPRDTTELALTSSTIKELRNASIESVVGLTAIELIDCESLVSLPTNIWKLKSLKSLHLWNCPNFQNFPEISEVMEYLEFLNLSCTAVKELPPSIRNLVALRELHLCSCNNLESLPELPPSLKAIDLFRCSKFQYFPKILKPMEHLKILNLYGTAVKELPPSIGNLVAIRKLDLEGCWNLEVVPDELFCLTSLQVLTLRGTKIKSIPASIKQKAAQLSRLFLINCKSLESLPELPPLLQHLHAEGCTSLKTLSSSSTALAQDWEKYKFSRELHEQYIFFNCPELDENARSNIMADAQLRIMRMATASSKFKEDKIEKASYNSNKESSIDKIEEPSYDSDDSYDDESYDSNEDKIEEPSYYSDENYDHFHDYSYGESSVAIRCCGNEIPNWFPHKSEGCSIKIELPRDWFSTDFLGFALSVVVGGEPRYLHIGCKYNFKTSNGKSHEVDHGFSQCLGNYFSFDSSSCDGVFVWWCNQRPTAFDKLVTEVNVDFTARSNDVIMKWKKEVEVKKCGICLLYGKDAEMIKQRAL